MALLTSELQRLRFECGYNALAAGAEPYVGVTAIFDQVVATYLTAGASTTSSTTVTAATSPTPVTLTLASSSGFATFARVWVDVDARQESATVQAVSGATITVLLSLAHTGTYPVTVEGGEAMVRDQLRKLRTIDEQLTGAYSSAGIKQVDEVHFFGDSAGSSRIDALLDAQMEARDELCSLLGVENMWRRRRGAMQTLSLY